MMNDIRAMEEERSILRWGGLAGILAGVLLILSFLVFVMVLVLAAGALLHIAQDPLSELYHAPGATPGEREALVLLWQATVGIFDALLVMGLVLVPIGLIALGAAMRSARPSGAGAG